jgi:type IV secretion system protein VirD4
LTNNVIVFGGGKDGLFYREISELVGTARVARTTYSTGRGGWGKTTAGEDVPILRPEEIRQLPQRQALVIAENARPLIAKLTRCVDGRHGRALLAAQDAARDRVSAARRAGTSLAERTANAVQLARELELQASDSPFTRAGGETFR